MGIIGAIQSFLEGLEGVVDTLNGIFFSTTTVYILLSTGVLFTIMSAFGQYRSLTHGVSVIRGKYDKKGDPGAINHFQALSAALSATVGLGNIAGVAAAVSLGGPGAVFWMWVIGIVGMAIKMFEVTQSMLYRNTDDPENPHGGPMFVVAKGFKEIGCPRLGKILGGLFCVTLLLFAFTGGNMFQSWNVADVTSQYTEIPPELVGSVLAILVGLVIIGGIKRIGAVAGRIVPFMCGIYVLAAIVVLLSNAGQLPGLLWMIVEHGVGLREDADAAGAFLGGSFGYAFMFGVQRALFSSEAGFGSAPIAHSAAKTDEPVREGVVAGLEPFIDTIVVCTMTALVILSTGTWSRGPEATAGGPIEMRNVVSTAIAGEDKAEIVRGVVLEEDEFSFTLLVLEAESEPVRRIDRASVDGEALNDLWGDELDRLALKNRGLLEEGAALVSGEDLKRRSYVVSPDFWAPALAGLPERTDEARKVSKEWEVTDELFLLVHGARSKDTRTDAARVFGKAVPDGEGGLALSWSPFERNREPTVIDTEAQPAGLYGHYVGAGMTAHAFDRAFPGLRLGMYLVITASWLFALSTMISWSYYGEQGVVFLFGDGKTGVMIYKALYCVLVFVSSIPFIKTEEQLNAWSTLGIGIMLIANIPIMLIFSAEATRNYHHYINRLKRGELEPGSGTEPGGEG